MRKNSLRLLLIITFLRTGISNSSIIISHIKEGERLHLTCDLSGDENLTQVNWEIQWPNRTNVGIFHPVHGTYVPPAYADRVTIEGRPLGSSASLSLDKMPLSKIKPICCVFMTFPSGQLMQCYDDDGVNADSRKTEAQEAGRKLGLFGQLGALTVACILSISFFIISVYICHSCLCRRTQEFEVQQSHYIDPSTTSQMFTEDAREVRHTPPAPGFDPKKLYAKITKDLYYGRLWKSYQGRTRISTEGSPPGSKIYYRLGERPLPQGDEEERPVGPDTMVTPSSSDSDRR